MVKNGPSLNLLGFCVLVWNVSYMETSFVICVLVKKRIENNRSSVKTAISLCSTLSLLGKKGFLFFVWVSKPFLVAGQNCFPFSHLNANSIRPSLCRVPKLTLIIKNCLRCPRCLTPPSNSNKFLPFFLS